MSIQKSKNPKNKPVSVYLGKFETEKLNKLMKLTGFNQSETIRRLINNADINSIETIDDKVKRLSKGRLEVVNPKIPQEFKDKYSNLTTDDLIGVGTVPDSEQPFDPVKAVKDIRSRKGR
ncbi:hypothetical protein [Methanobrevibacter filiformis]|uniref:Uncharacterized protein n=1 Tax=Methanobrevibacter filiformis TaxID=55758 RepID=A0A166AEW8_9EURY|nr:hypothetical protein [Methanobrevibacter filiformis]KZX11943.1 hypothetical protein MBFIL_12810 [Methanobrevibacter filiformis]